MSMNHDMQKMRKERMQVPDRESCRNLHEELYRM